MKLQEGSTEGVEMGGLRIIAGGISPQAQAQARGKLFEGLMTAVLRNLGYQIDAIPNVNYSGMEIDIEGRSIATGVSLYAECKCYATEVDAPKLQQFFGKYMALWMENRKSQGLFIALPGVNSHAKGFYRERIENKPDITVRLLEEDSVLQSIYQSGEAARPEAMPDLVKQLGTPGESELLYTPRGFFWAKLIIPSGEIVPTKVTFFDNQGRSLTDTSAVEYIMELAPDLREFELVLKKEEVTTVQVSSSSGGKELREEIVEVRGGSECFEYQFPASPDFFFGRDHIMEELQTFVSKVNRRETSSRGVLLDANSGWGKSSVVLATVDRLKKGGHFAVAIDSRSAASSQFILRAIEHVLTVYGDFDGAWELPSGGISGFDGAAKALVSLGRALSKEHRVLFIFLDQFENLFHFPEALHRIVELLLKLCDSQTNVVLGFSWKSDLIDLTSEFPYQLRDSIVSSSHVVHLGEFTEVETNALLERLSVEIRAPLRKDLKFFLSEFSQGYPWLLKKLCAHVKSQRQERVAQSDIARSLLNVEGLFQEDLRGLSASDEDALKRISKLAPINVGELGDEFRADVVQSLVNRRLIVRIGNKYDIYWDIFRDYLNSGRVPVQENYVLRVQIGSIMKSMRTLKELGGKPTAKVFRTRSELSIGSFHNVMRDLRMLGLADSSDDGISALVSFPQDQAEFQKAFRLYIKDRLKRNRLVWYILQKLESEKSVDLTVMGSSLSEACPYITATMKTWQTYARLFADWMDFADLAVYDSKSAILARYEPGTQVRDRAFYGSRARRIAVPIIQYSPMMEIAVKIAKAVQTQGVAVDWSTFSRSTISKSLASLEMLGFIRRGPKLINVNAVTTEFAAADEVGRASIFANAALKNQAFSNFIQILNMYSIRGESLNVLAGELKKKMGADWKLSTAEVYVKVMLDWARHANVAPGVFAKSRRGMRPVPEAIKGSSKEAE